MHSVLQLCKFTTGYKFGNVWPLGISLSSPLSPLDAIAVAVVSNSAFWCDRVVRAHLLTFLLQN